MRRMVKCRSVSLKTLINGIDSSYPASAQRSADASLVSPGFMGVFMSGLFQEFDQPGTFTYTVPAGIFKLRVRTLGRGSGGHAYQAGSGGGYADGVFDVTPGEVFTIKVPDLRANAFTQAEFGNATRGIILRATNGVTGGSAIGGVGYGGDYQSTGGAGVGSGSSYPMAGSASGSRVSKVGGVGLTARSSGGAGARGNAGNLDKDWAGGSETAATYTANGLGVSLTGLALPPGFPRFKLDGLYGDGNSGLPGAGGGTNAFPGVCGGSGPKVGTVLQVVYGGGLHNSLANNALITARGLVIVEW